MTIVLSVRAACAERSRSAVENVFASGLLLRQAQDDKKGVHKVDGKGGPKTIPSVLMLRSNPPSLNEGKELQIY